MPLFDYVCSTVSFYIRLGVQWDLGVIFNLFLLLSFLNSKREPQLRSAPPKKFPGEGPLIHKILQTLFVSPKGDVPMWVLAEEKAQPPAQISLSSPRVVGVLHLLLS